MGEKKQSRSKSKERRSRPVPWSRKCKSASVCTYFFRPDRGNHEKKETKKEERRKSTCSEHMYSVLQTTVLRQGSLTREGSIKKGNNMQKKENKRKKTLRVGVRDACKPISITITPGRYPPMRKRTQSHTRTHTYHISSISNTIYPSHTASIPTTTLPQTSQEVHIKINHSSDTHKPPNEPPPHPTRVFHPSIHLFRSVEPPILFIPQNTCLKPH